MPTVMLLHPSMVLLLAHHQVLCYCSFSKPDPCTKSKSLVLQDYSNCYGIIFVDKCVMAEISESPHSVQLDPQSLLGFKTLVAAFINR